MDKRLASIITKYLGKDAVRNSTRRKTGFGSLPLPKELKQSK